MIAPVQGSRRILGDVPQEVGGCLRAVIRHLPMEHTVPAPSTEATTSRQSLQKVAETTPSEVKEFVMWKSSEDTLTLGLCEHLKIGVKHVRCKPHV